MVRFIPRDLELLGYSQCLSKMLGLCFKHPDDVKLFVLGVTPEGRMMYRVSTGRGPSRSGLFADPHAGCEPEAYTTAYFWAKWMLASPERLRSRTLDLYFMDPDFVFSNQSWFLRSRSLIRSLERMRREVNPLLNRDWAFVSEDVPDVIDASDAMERSFDEVGLYDEWAVGHSRCVGDGVYFRTVARTPETDTVLGESYETLPFVRGKFFPTSMRIARDGPTDSVVPQIAGTRMTFPMDTRALILQAYDGSRIGSSSFERVQERNQDVVGVMAEVPTYQPPSDYWGAAATVGWTQGQFFRKTFRAMIILNEALEVISRLPPGDPAVNLVNGATERWRWGTHKKAPDPLRVLSPPEVFAAVSGNVIYLLRDRIVPVTAVMTKFGDRLDGRQRLLGDELHKQLGQTQYEADAWAYRRLPPSEGVCIQFLTYELAYQIGVLDRRLDPAIIDEAKAIQGIDVPFGYLGMGSLPTIEDRDAAQRQFRDDLTRALNSGVGL